MKYIAVLLTVHNRKDKTLLCLKNLYAQSIPQGYGMDVYLTDDGCTDGTAEAVRVEYPLVNIVEGDGNLYWNRGMYRAWEEAAKKDYDFYLWLNDDTFTYLYMLQSLVDAANTLKSEGIIVGITQDLAHTRTTYGGRMNGKLLSPNGKLQECRDINGNILLVPKYVFSKIGGMDWTFLHAGGDTEYGWRAIKNGIKVYVSQEYLGECDLHEKMDKWCDPEVSLKERWKALYAPNGVRPPEFFYLERKYKGMGLAVFHYITTHLHCLLPIFWIRKMKKQLK